MSDSTSGRQNRIIYSRDLIRELVIRNIKLRYQHSVLGVIWAVLNPLAFMLTFSVIRGALRVNVENYSLFALTGIVAWHWFQDGLMLAANSITSNRELITRPAFPLPLLPLIAVITAFVDLLVSIPLLFIFIGLKGITPAILALPLLMIPQFLLILGLGYILASFNVTYRDVQHLLGVILKLLFFLTPIFYDASHIPDKFRTVFNMNPMAYLIDAYRAILIHGELPDLFPLLILFIISLVIVRLGLILFRRASLRFVEEI